MSDVTENMLEEQFCNYENLTTAELTDKELAKVTGAEFGFSPFNNSTAFAVTSIAFTQNNDSCIW